MRDLRGDDALDVAVFDIEHEVAVAVAVGVGAGLLVGIHFDGGGFDAEDVGGVFAGTLALTGETPFGQPAQKR